ncbi:MAG: AI-2E family transporter [Vicingaceae bacterium]|nr:MAG: AI-2E family transporter [Vicingaceae bacterium]
MPGYSISSFFYGLATLVLLGYLFSVGDFILIPFFLAVLIFLFLNKSSKVLVNFIKQHVWKNMPFWSGFLMVFLVMSAMAYLMINTLIVNIQEIITFVNEGNLTIPEEKLSFFNKIFDQTKSQLLQWQEKNLDIAGIISKLFSGIMDILNYIFMVLLYLIFIILEARIIPMKIKSLSRYSRQSSSKILNLLEDVEDTVSTYLFQKTLISVLTGFLSYIVFVLFGLPFAFIWAFLIFSFNFIPNIGSIIASLLPFVFSLVIFDGFAASFWMLAAVGAIQLIIGNFVEPYWMGNSMNLSPLTVLFALAFWGSIWGISGMLICVPITVIILMIFARFPSTRSIAILMSNQGNIDEKSD